MKKSKSGKLKNRLLAAGAVVLAAAVGFGMPVLLRDIQDAKRLSTVTTEEASEVRVTPQTKLGIAEKAELFQSADANSTVLEKGKNYDRKTSIQKAEEEIQTLCEIGVLDETFRTAKVTDDEAKQSITPIFYIDPSGEKSMIVWMLAFPMDTENDSWSVEVALDDETGKILGLDVQKWDESDYNGIISDAGTETGESVSGGQSGRRETTAGFDIADRAGKFGSYLGLTVERVTQSWELADSILSDEEKTSYENQVRIYEKKGYTEEEARKRASEEWGLTDAGPDGSESAQITYREGDSSEVRYYLRLGAESLAIYFDL